jgi:hypothetical protein
MTPRFDPTRAIVYDLSRGQLHDDEGASRLNLPAHLLLRLCEHAGLEGTVEFARALGEDLGRRVASRLGAEASVAGIEAWTEHLGGQVALLGLGNLSVEQWGRALVLRVGGMPSGLDRILESVLEGALQRGIGRQVSLIGFSRGDEIEFLVLSPETSHKARTLAQSGAGLGQVVEELHKGAA